MKKCPFCKKQIDEDAFICPECGMPIKESIKNNAIHDHKNTHKDKKEVYNSSFVKTNLNFFDFAKKKIYIILGCIGFMLGVFFLIAYLSNKSSDIAQQEIDTANYMKEVKVAVTNGNTEDIKRIQEKYGQMSYTGKIYDDVKKTWYTGSMMYDTRTHSWYNGLLMFEYPMGYNAVTEDPSITLVRDYPTLFHQMFGSVDDKKFLGFMSTPGYDIGFKKFDNTNESIGFIIVSSENLTGDLGNMPKEFLNWSKISKDVLSQIMNVNGLINKCGSFGQSQQPRCVNVSVLTGKVATYMQLIRIPELLSMNDKNIAKIANRELHVISATTVEKGIKIEISFWFNESNKYLENNYKTILNSTKIFGIDELMTKLKEYNSKN